VARKVALTAPDDLDEAALRKWRELEAEIRPSQSHLLANFCRNHENLLEVRKAKAAAVKAGTFSGMVVSKNGALGPSPYIRAETRLLALENRMLLALGIGDEDLF
jgi:phage terminase small subunit